MQSQFSTEQITRFWSRVNRDGDCWEWTGGLDQDGYGQIHIRRTLRAHRVAYELGHGPIPQGMWVCHTCDNPRCCRPSHLYLGTAMDNARDMIEKSRQWVARGEDCPSAKLTEAQVLQIRSRYERNRVGYKALADEYGVNPGTILKIVRRMRWKHLA